MFIKITFSVCIFLNMYTVFAQNTKKEGNPEKIVQIQLDAYNRQDVKAFAATYSDTVKVYNFNDNEPYLTGNAALEKSYAEFFKKNPSNFAAIQSRIIEGNYVIDKEKVTSTTYTFFGTAIYLVQNGLIQKVWFLK